MCLLSNFRRNVPSITAVAIGLVSLPWLGVAAAQHRSASTVGGNVVVGTVASEVGTTVAIPVYFEPGKNSGVRSLHMEIDFVSNSIKFAKAEKGIASKGLNFEINVAANELPPDDKKISHTRLKVDVSVTDADASKSLPSGLVAFLNFNIPENAKPFSISLTPLTVSGEDAAKKPVEVAAEAGKVIVSIPDAPLAGCFFFSH